MHVLDEIGERLSVIETIRRLSSDPATDELHTHHPLILRSRWLFGHEFDPQEYCSNATLQTVARTLFKNQNARSINERNRPDMVVLPDGASCQITGVECFDPAEPVLCTMQNILLLELKKGGSTLTSRDLFQTYDYVQDIASSGFVMGASYICAWAVGHRVAPKVGDLKVMGEKGQELGWVRATTYAALVDVANRRLLRLRDRLSGRYEEMTTDALLQQMFSSARQEELPYGMEVPGHWVPVREPSVLR